MVNLTEKTKAEIMRRVKDCGLFLLAHEDKPYCMEQVPEQTWKEFSSNGTKYVIIPTPIFYNYIIDRRYNKVVEKYPENFGTEDDFNIVKAIYMYENEKNSLRESVEDFFSWFKQENHAYIFKVESDESVCDRVLRLDLCRDIKGKRFLGGLLHAMKHFAIKGVETTFSSTKEYELETFNELYKRVVLNFFNGKLIDEGKGEKTYTYITEIPNEDKLLKVVYYKEEESPAYFLNTAFVIDKDRCKE